MGGTAHDVEHAVGGGETGKTNWAEGLDYPDWMKAASPAVHSGFNAVNRYISVPALKAGLGRWMSTPFAGYLMILRTRGRKSGEMRDAPLGYVVLGQYVYCLAGFGRQTHWFRNIEADPQVEVILPSRALSGIAEEVTDPDERRRALFALLRSMGLIAGMFGMGNAWSATPEEVERKCEGMPVVRIHATGIAAGPEDPGGWFWVVPIGASVLGGLWLLRRMTRGKRGRP